ncbi:PREDICTED: dCTP pyrophosphatase 1-like isoform X2 [Amphimedon queenslandica]|uniref:dCTP pyrophosphatase 1 n=1 Tax=Amphimedon queenslandica TaxID=400682 RepID=A0AAN0JBU2_AMPQE|nr:PREDICTED: dCTP pyrophosphatase 1-like isoform X2 [Amphimedon queenslandica]|eukprot:XP_019854168.1 PREDICTED: dCTP pyrophosphatase 1-like isoform X2 [Amphimedon queenslandica]
MLAILNMEVSRESEARGEAGNCGTASPLKKQDYTFSSSLSLEQIKKQNQFSMERDWEQYHTPRNLLLALVGEVGELSEIFQWKGEVDVGLPGWSHKDRAHVGEELSDILIYLIELAEKCHIDLPSAVLRKFELNFKKYPPEKVYGSSKKYTEYISDDN